MSSLHGVTASDVPAALVMGLAFFAFGLAMILRPDCIIRANFDCFADFWKQGSWRPYKMRHWGLRAAGVVIVAAALSSRSPTSPSDTIVVKS